MVVQTAAADAADARKKNYLRSAHANAIVKKANEISDAAAATVAAARNKAAADAVTIAALRQQVRAVKYYIFFKFWF